MFRIGGVSAPVPQEAEYLPVVIGDLSRRNALGEKVCDVVARKRDLRLEWRMLSLSEASALLGAVSPPFSPWNTPTPRQVRAYRRFMRGRDAPLNTSAQTSSR